ncbi:MAG: dihydroorotate dehydrogenase electron transfer subunit [Candidatus Methanomethylophilaceae archaeon]|jgi:dihydroorotate dehydrogenase electron transfer subunit
MINVVRIIKKTKESHDTYTFDFELDVSAVPGQFVMVWVPGVDEVPMSLSKTGKIKSITVKGIGEATNAIHKMNEGDCLRIRGPYGNGFNLEGKKKILAVAGGVGAAALLPAIAETGCDTIIGARSDKEIILDGPVKKYVKNLWISTDDGSRGFHGNAVELAKEKIISGKYDLVIGCGPEIMLFFLHKACKELGVDCLLSLERHMKCGTGVCGCCVIDGERVCKDGPVFDSEQLDRLSDFGSRKRDECGCIINLR